MQVELINANINCIVESAKNVSSGSTISFKEYATKYRIRIRRKRGNFNANNSTWWAMRTNSSHGNFGYN